MKTEHILAKDLLCALDPEAFAKYYLDFEAEDWQQKVLRSQHPRQVLNCSRQSGKSTIAAIIAAHLAVYKPKSLTLMVSASQRQSSEIFRKVSEFLMKMPIPPKRLEDNKLSLQLKNGSRVISLPADAKRIRGFSGPDLIIEDEAAQVAEDVHTAIKPMLAVSKGRLILLSTPSGLAGHFYEICSENDEIWERHTVTAFECKHIPRDFLDQERLTIPRWEFDQEYLCKFIGIVNQPFNFFKVQQCLSDQVQPLFLYDDEGNVVGRNMEDSRETTKEYRRLFIGVDLGKSVDFSAISIIEKLGSGINALYQIRHLERLPLGTSYPDIVDHVGHLIDALDADRKPTLVVDKSGLGAPVLDYFKSDSLAPRGITITSGLEPRGRCEGDWNVPRDDLITQTQFLIDTGKLQIAKSLPLALDLVEELVHIRQSDGPRSKTKKNPRPKRVHDDLAMSALLPLWYAKNALGYEIEFLSV